MFSWFPSWVHLSLGRAVHKTTWDQRKINRISVSSTLWFVATFLRQQLQRSLCFHLKCAAYACWASAVSPCVWVKAATLETDETSRCYSQLDFCRLLGKERKLFLSVSTRRQLICMWRWVERGGANGQVGPLGLVCAYLCVCERERKMFGEGLWLDFTPGNNHLDVWKLFIDAWLFNLFYWESFVTISSIIHSKLDGMVWAAFPPLLFKQSCILTETIIDNSADLLLPVVKERHYTELLLL